MKYKRKLAPATTFDFAAMETWLSDMAEDGWIPVDFRGEKVKFQQAEPQKRSYRIAIPRYFDTQPTAKQLEAYRQLGWEFICTYRCKGYLLANITEHPQEPYTDPAVQKKNIEELYQEERYLYLAGMVLGTLFFVGLGLLTWHYLGRNIIDPNWVLEFYGPILFLLLAVFNFYELRLLKRLKTSLEQGLPISHEKDYTKKLQLKRISNLIYAILGITLLLPPSRTSILLLDRTKHRRRLRFGFSSALCADGRNHKKCLRYRNQPLFRADTLCTPAFPNVRDGRFQLNGYHALRGAPLLPDGAGVSDLRGKRHISRCLPSLNGRAGVGAFLRFL